MGTYTDYQQRELDIESGLELDRIAARRSRTILPGASPHPAPSSPHPAQKRSTPDLYGGIKPWRP